MIAQLLPRDMCRDLAGMGRVTVFEQIYPLPCPKYQSPVSNGDRQADGHHCGFDVGRHIVGPFVGVGQVRHAGISRGWHKTREEVAQIRLHLGVCIFLNKQAGRGVADEERQKARAVKITALQPTSDVAGDLIKPLPLRIYAECRLHGLICADLSG